MVKVDRHDNVLLVIRQLMAKSNLLISLIIILHKTKQINGYLLYNVESYETSEFFYEQFECRT